MFPHVFRPIYLGETPQSVSALQPQPQQLSSGLRHLRPPLHSSVFARPPQSALQPQPQQLPSGLRHVRLPRQHSSVFARPPQYALQPQPQQLPNGLRPVRPQLHASVVARSLANRRMRHGLSEAFPMGNNPERGMTGEKNVLPPDAEIKTPVSVLQEVLSKSGLTPTYEMEQIEGACHEPTFRYRVSFNDKHAMGVGKSKKKAKHTAAASLIEQLSGLNLGAKNKTRKHSSFQDDQASHNPICWLNEECKIRRWPLPTYVTEAEVGLPHQRVFTIACAVRNFYEVGQGNTKKMAKREAAHKMWLTLADNDEDDLH